MSLQSILNAFFFPANKYYRMTTKELELEANKYKIGEYYDGKISRKLIIEQLVFKDKANHSFVAIVVSIIALLFSLLGIIVGYAT